MYRPADFQQRCKSNSVDEAESSATGAGAREHPQTNNLCQPQPCDLHKKYPKMDSEHKSKR